MEDLSSRSIRLIANSLNARPYLVFDSLHNAVSYNNMMLRSTPHLGNIVDHLDIKD